MTATGGKNGASTMGWSFIAGLFTDPPKVFPGGAGGTPDGVAGGNGFTGAFGYGQQTGVNEVPIYVSCVIVGANEVDPGTRTCTDSSGNLYDPNSATCTAGEGGDTCTTTIQQPYSYFTITSCPVGTPGTGGSNGTQYGRGGDATGCNPSNFSLVVNGQNGGNGYVSVKSVQ